MEYICVPRRQQALSIEAGGHATEQAASIISLIMMPVAEAMQSNDNRIKMILYLVHTHIHSNIPCHTLHYFYINAKTRYLLNWYRMLCGGLNWDRDLHFWFNEEQCLQIENANLHLSHNQYLSVVRNIYIYIYSFKFTVSCSGFFCLLLRKVAHIGWIT